MQILMLQVVVNMKIYKLNFSLYGIIIILSIVIGTIYIYRSLKKEGYSNKNIFLYFLMYVMFALFFGKFYTMVTNPEETKFLTAGLSAYGGLVGTILAAIIFEKILPCDNKIIKYSILALPLIYSLTKIACFVSGCCYGIPYDGFLSVTYVDGLNINVFPIQITETVAFLILFLFCNKFKDKENIEYITLILTAILKFLLDFLRYDHLTISITTNQIFSIILIILTILIWIYNRFIFNKIKNK